MFSIILLLIYIILIQSIFNYYYYQEAKSYKDTYKIAKKKWFELCRDKAKYKDLFNRAMDIIYNLKK
jgi:hypothetical protein